MRRAIIIGGGVGGLAAAIHLAGAGVEVRLFERAATVGGKLRDEEVGGQRLLAGPSVLTMRWVFDELFGGHLDRYLALIPLAPLCRHFFPDGSRLDLFTDEAESRAAIAAFAGERDAAGYVRYRRHAARIFERVRGPFMEGAPPSLAEIMSPRALWQLGQIDGMRTLAAALADHFVDPRLRQLFGRYATYNGSSPYHAPATLSVIVHVENAGGIFAVAGGIVRLAEALRARAEELGVTLTTSASVDEILIAPRGRGRWCATGVRLGGETVAADLVFANCDVADAYATLLRGLPLAARALSDYRRRELSLSAFVLLALGAPSPLPLLHHNVFFSGDYRREFEELIERRLPPREPTVYLCSEAPGQYFLLSNAPPLDERGGAIDWTSERLLCQERLLATLARHGWPFTATAQTALTPADFASRFPESRGALYGLASNSRLTAFVRPKNRLSHVDGLYFCGGSVHPGAGLPMVALSARIASGLALAKALG